MNFRVNKFGKYIYLISTNHIHININDFTISSFSGIPWISVRYEFFESSRFTVYCKKYFVVFFQNQLSIMSIVVEVLVLFLF